jgi:arylsulfatase A-like enzyme
VPVFYSDHPTASDVGVPTGKRHDEKELWVTGTTCQERRYLSSTTYLGESTFVTPLRRRWAFVLVLPLLVTAGQIPIANPTAGAPRRPNVLIIVTDDQRQGLAVMPQTRQWMKKGGTRFANAFVTTPLCCPSRSSIFTGRYTHNHGVLGNNGQGVNLAQRSTLQYYLHRAGYETAMYGKYLNGWDIAERPPHFQHFAMTASSLTYTNGIWNVGGTVKTVAEYNTTYITNKARHFLKHAGTAHTPWFLYLAPAAPHGPYIPDSQYAKAPVSPWAGDPAVPERDRSDKPPYVQVADRGFRYGAETRKAQFRTLMSIDDLVSTIFNTLKDLGEVKNTLVFLVSDNGLMWGEHGLQQKAVPYEQAIHVPLLVRWPGHLLAHATDNRIVANIDIAPTVLQATGITPSPAYPIDGRTLLGTSTLRHRLLTEQFTSGEDPQYPQGSWASLRTNAYKYTEYYAPDRTTVIFREYYNLRTDPWELRNLLGDDDLSNDPDVGALSSQLAQARVCRGTEGASACP